MTPPGGGRGTAAAGGGKGGATKSRPVSNSLNPHPRHNLEPGSTPTGTPPYLHGDSVASRNLPPSGGTHADRRALR